MREAEKRGTGSSLFGGQNWAKRTIQLSNGTLSYSASAAEMAAGKVKKAPVSLLGYDVVEPFGSPAGISELHLKRQLSHVLCCTCHVGGMRGLFQVHLHRECLIFEVGGLGFELGGLDLHGGLHGCLHGHAIDLRLHGYEIRPRQRAGGWCKGDVRRRGGTAGGG